MLGDSVADALSNGCNCGVGRYPDSEDGAISGGLEGEEADDATLGGGGRYGGFFRPGGSSSHSRCPGGTTMPISTAGSMGPAAAAVFELDVAGITFSALLTAVSSSFSSSRDSALPTILSSLTVYQ